MGILTHTVIDRPDADVASKAIEHCKEVIQNLQNMGELVSTFHIPGIEAELLKFKILSTNLLVENSLEAIREAVKHIT